MIVFRVFHYVGQFYSEQGEDFLLYVRHTGPAQLVIRATWFFLLPFFTGWTVLGTSWHFSILRETPDCLPQGTHSCFVIFWQILCYIWIAIYAVFAGVACSLERSVSAAELDHARIIASEDSMHRWGALPFLPDYSSIRVQGLSHSQIKTLPSSSFGSLMRLKDPGAECAICLCSFGHDDSCRQLQGCGHLFHETCIDLWLLQRADCPLCKQSITINEQGGLQEMAQAAVIDI